MSRTATFVLKHGCIVARIENFRSKECWIERPHNSVFWPDTLGASHTTWGVHFLRSPNFFPLGMEADRNVKVVGGDVAVL